MATKVTIKGAISANQVALIADAVASESAGQITVSPGKNLISTKSFGIFESMTIIGGIASLVSLIITLLDKYEDSTQKDEWSVDRVRQIVDDEMALRNIANTRIDSMTGFGNLVGRRRGSCSVVASDV